VYVTTAGGTPLGGAVVTLSVTANHGSFVATGTEAVTGPNGMAVFPSFTLSKAGGYTISASAAFDQIGGPLATSALFNVKNKSAP
jgi:hypothetical protein